jgi:hypothetical protein
MEREPGVAMRPVVVCEVHGTVDLAVVDLLAHLRLHARRVDVTLDLRDPDGRLEVLLELTGLGGCVLQRSEPGRHPEPREQRGVEEVVDVADPAG